MKKVILFTVFCIITHILKAQTELNTILGTQENGRLGSAVSISNNGNRMAVSEPRYNINGKEQAGRVRIFDLNASNEWIQVGNAIEGEERLYRLGEESYLSSDGNYIINSTQNKRKILFHEFTAGNWVKLNEIEWADRYGGDIVINKKGTSLGTRIAIGDYHTQTVKTFEYTPTTKELVSMGDIRIGTLGGDDTNFGSSVAMDLLGRTIAISAYDYDVDTNTDAGIIRVYYYDNITSRWVLKGNEIQGNVAYQKLGKEIALNEFGNIIAVYSSGLASESVDPKVTVYKLDGGSWVQLGNEIESTQSDILNLSSDIEISNDGTRLVLSNSFKRTVIIYDLIENSWVKVGKSITDSEEFSQFGEDISINGAGTILAVGASTKDTSSLELVGMVKTYDISSVHLPQAVCRNATFQLDDSGVVTITPDDIDNGSTASSGIASRTVSPNTFSCVNIGEQPVTLTITDSLGRTSQCTTNIIIEDNISPRAICKNISVTLSDSGKATITANDIDNGSIDNCSIIGRSLDITEFDESNLGENIVTLTVFDELNSDNCQAIVTVLANTTDNTPPTVITQNIMVELDESGNAIITPEQVNNGSTDDTDAPTDLVFSVDKTNFTCSNIGENTVTLTVTDTVGNSATATAIVTIQDNLPPTVITQNITVELDESGKATITPDAVNNGSTDNCGIASIKLNKRSFNCTDLGDVRVALIVTDTNGNMTTENATVTVIDTIAPTAVCQNITVQLNSSGLATITPAYIDNGSTDNCAITNTTVNISEFNTGNIGENIITFTVEDASGNTTNCRATVTVEENPLSTNTVEFSEVKLYPNPVKNEVFILNPQQKPLSELLLYDLTGRLVKRIFLKSTQPKKTINISDLESALYVTILKSKQGHTKKQILVKE